jgi:hypothetical protein
LRKAIAIACLCASIAACEAPAPAPPEPPIAAPAAPAPAPEPAVPSLPPTAKPAMLDEIRADLAAARSPADGGGRAWFDPGPRARVVAESLRRLEIVYEAGPLGIAPGGSILLERRIWWFWTAPQSTRPEEPGYVTAATRAPGVELALRDVPATGASVALGGVAIEIRGRSLRAGERVEIVYGAGPALAQVDAFAERDERLWLYVDGDGDGVRGLVAESPLVDVEAAEPSQLWIALPSTARVGEDVRVVVALLDRRANWCRASAAKVELRADGGLELPASVSIRGGRAEVVARVAAPGILRAQVRGLGGRAAQSNPLVVLPGTRRVLWADLHGHSHFSDGTGTPEDYFRYARDIAALDVAVLTDHDHLGRQTLDAMPDKWREIRAQTEAFHAPGRFVTLLGFEWTSWIHGHRHVLYFDRDGPVISTLDPLRESPQQLWDALRGRRALTFAHHSAGGPIATNWAIPPDPELEPVTEIVSVHGSSEGPDGLRPVKRAAAGNFVRDVLLRGYRLGFVGSGDGHDGHPGLVHLGNSGMGGLAAILADEATRESVHEALRARRVYATSGPRIVLDATLDGAPMGSLVKAAGAPGRLAVRAVGEGPIARIDVIRGAAVARSIPGERRLRVGFTEPLAPLAPGEAIYVRVLQEDQGAAWSSPFFVE